MTTTSTPIPAPVKALDTYAALTPAKLAALKADGYGALGLYYFKTSGFKHLLDAATVKATSAAGLRLFSVYENGEPVRASYFTVPTANMDAHVAHTRALDAGQPAGTPIFFAVDYDADITHIPAIIAYFNEINRVFGVMGDTHPIGVYGSGMVCRRLKVPGLVSFTWLCQSHGFAEYNDFLPHADIIQGPQATVHGMDTDSDSAVNPAVLWSV